MLESISSIGPSRAMISKSEGVDFASSTVRFPAVLAFTTAFSGIACWKHSSRRQERSRKRCNSRNNSYLLSTADSATPSPSSSFEQNGRQTAASIIPGTPCFSKRIMGTPMDRAVRQQYLNDAGAAFESYLHSFLSNPSSVSRLAQLTLLLPELNPLLDVYDRRFLLQFTWTLLRVTASLGLRACVLTQGARLFGAMPLSVAGLRRNFEADLELSRSEWPENSVFSRELEDLEAIGENVDIVLVLSPTNAVSIPAVESVMNLVHHFKDKPITLVNPRLEEVPSHSGVMQVQGRRTRLALLESFEDIFYMRLLFDSGKNYPLRGILYKAYPSQWQAWYCPSDDEYVLALELEQKPDLAKVSDVFRKKQYQIQKQKMAQSGDEVAIEQLLLSPPVIAGFILLVAFLIYKEGGDSLPTLWNSLRSTVP